MRRLFVPPFVAAIGWVGACGTSLEETPSPTGDTGLTASTTRKDTGRTTPSPRETGLASATVTLRLGADRLEPEVRVMIADADGVFVRTVTTDAAEIVVEDVPFGAFITEVRQAVAGMRLTTLGGVQNGEVIPFPTAGESAPEALGSYQIAIDDGPDVPFAIWELGASCVADANGAFPYAREVPLTTNCHAGTRVDAFAWAYTVTLDPVALAFVGDAPLIGTAPSLGGTVNLGSWTTDFARIRATYTHAGPESILDLRIAPRRSGVSQPQGLAKSQRINDGERSDLVSPATRAFHDEYQALFAVAELDSPVRTELLVGERSVPADGQELGVQLAREDLPVLPESWVLDPNGIEVPMPEAWSCFGRGANVLEVEQSAPGITWHMSRDFVPTVGFPELDPDDDPRPKGGFVDVEVAVRSVEGGWDAVRALPDRTEGPSAWLSATPTSGTVCSTLQGA